MKKQYRIVVAEDHTILREGLRALLGADRQLDIVGEAEDEIAAINIALGASYMGIRSLTATSGGGFSLMAEAFGLA